MPTMELTGPSNTVTTYDDVGVLLSKLLSQLAFENAVRLKPHFS